MTENIMTKLIERKEYHRTYTHNWLSKKSIIVAKDELIPGLISVMRKESEKRRKKLTYQSSLSTPSLTDGQIINLGIVIYSCI